MEYRFNIKPSDSESNIKLLVKEGVDVSNISIFNYNHINQGLVYETNIPTPDGFVDVTNVVLSAISKRDGKKYKGLNISKSSGYIFRNDAELERITYFDKLDKKTKTEALQVGAYISFYKGVDKNIPGSRIYRINSMSDTSVNLEYTAFNQDGKIISILKTLPIETVIDTVSSFYLLKGNSKIKSLLSKTNKIAPKESDIQDKLLDVLSKTLSNAFGGIEVEITDDTKSFESNQYAKIQNGKVIINKKSAKEENVIHEFLHLFLFSLKYNNNKEYEDLLLSYKKERNR